MGSSYRYIHVSIVLCIALEIIIFSTKIGFGSVDYAKFLAYFSTQSFNYTVDSTTQTQSTTNDIYDNLTIVGYVLLGIGVLSILFRVYRSCRKHSVVQAV